MNTDLSPLMPFFPRTILAILTVLVTWTGTVLPGWSHPHVWVDYAIEANFNQNGLTGFQHRWEFGEMFSSQIMEMFDANILLEAGYLNLRNGSSKLKPLGGQFNPSPKTANRIFALRVTRPHKIRVTRRFVP